MADTSNTTADHDTIRQWVEQRGGRPAAVKGTGSGDRADAILRIDFPGQGDDEAPQEISWDDFFRKFEEAAWRFSIRIRRLMETRADSPSSSPADKPGQLCNGSVTA